MINFRWHTKQRECFSFQTRYLIAICGRTFGKSRGVLQWLIEEIHNSYANIGWYVSITYKQAKIAFRYMQDIAHDTPGLKDIMGRPNKADLVIPFTTGKEIHFRSAEIPRNLRGDNTLGGLVLDEAGLMDDDVPATIRPCLSAFKCRTVYIGTPYGFNWYYQTFLDAVEDREFTIARYTSWDNPLIPKEEHDKTYESLVKTKGELFARQEMHAEFLAASMAVFQNVDKCVVSDVIAHDPLGRYCMGVDIAVKHDDTAIVVLNIKTLEVAHIEVLNNTSLNMIASRMFDIWQKYNRPVIYQDCTREEYAAEEIESRYMHKRFYIERVKFTVKNKNDIVGKAADSIGNARVKIPSTEMGKMLIGQLNIYERYTRTSGYESMEGRGGRKDDLVTALCLAFIGVPCQKSQEAIEHSRQSPVLDKYIHGGY